MITAVSSRPLVGAAVRVLLVEDNDGDARLTELMLEGTFGPDITLDRARTLAEAIAEVCVNPPDCVVLDLGLADAEGLEGVRAIKRLAPAVAIVVLTGTSDGDLGSQAVAAGAQDYLIKGNTKDETLTRSIRYAVLRKSAEDAMVRNQRALSEAQRIARTGSWELDFGSNTMVWSDELCRIYGYPAEPVPSDADLLSRFHPDDADALQELFRVSIAARGSFDVEHRIVRPNGEVRWLRSQARPEESGVTLSPRMYGTAQDITEQKIAADALTYQTLHDALTGLPNRTLFQDRLEQALGKMARSETMLGVLFIDVDRFKVINDSLGHAVGDTILQAMAHRLETSLRPGDTLARLGGDEFAVLCEDLQGDADAIVVADRINESMTAPLGSGDGELVVTVSIGIALASSSRVSAVSLLRDADAAMYRAKENGRDRSAVFAGEMHAKAVGRLDTEVALRRAITNGELETHYQPVVELPGLRIVALEALVRWRHPSRGLLGPDQFIRIAEETGLIVPLGAWVLRNAVRQMKSWHQEDPRFEQLKVAVNLSAVQVGHPSFIDTVSRALVDTGLPPHCLQLEITESVLMRDALSTLTILEALKALGVELAVDDFGTGYSSFSYIKRFPVDIVKIDRSFVEGLGNDPNDLAIVQAIIGLAGAINVGTVAEGVETAPQLQQLIELGCQRAQGFHFARPSPARTIGKLLHACGLVLEPGPRVTRS